MQPNPASNPAPQQPRLLDRLRDRLKERHVSPATITQYLYWTRQYILYQGIRHPRELDKDHVTAFLQHVAGTCPEAAGVARLALCQVTHC